MWYKLIDSPELKHLDKSNREKLIKEYHTWTFRFLVLRRLLPTLLSLIIGLYFGYLAKHLGYFDYPSTKETSIFEPILRGLLIGLPLYFGQRIGHYIDFKHWLTTQNLTSKD